MQRQPFAPSGVFEVRRVGGWFIDPCVLTQVVLGTMVLTWIAAVVYMAASALLWQPGT